jgi:hypothetical protein
LLEARSEGELDDLLVPRGTRRYLLTVPPDPLVAGFVPELPSVAEAGCKRAGAVPVVEREAYPLEEAFDRSEHLAVQFERPVCERTEETGSAIVGPAMDVKLSLIFSTTDVFHAGSPRKGSRGVIPQSQI